MNYLTLLLQVLPDGGLYYAETDPNAFIVEPWNAISSLSFWIPVFYWLQKLRGKWMLYPFLSFCMPLMFLGGLGSTLFHAFRSSPWLLLMDVLPILVLTLALSFYFWVKVLRHWIFALLILVGYFICRWFFFSYFPQSLAINLSYFMRGMLMFLPAVLLLRKIRYRFVEYLVLTIFFFVLALTFRYLDKSMIPWMYMGSHWLWHLSTTIGSCFLAEFLYRFANYERSQKMPWLTLEEETQ